MKKINVCIALGIALPLGLLVGNPVFAGDCDEYYKNLRTCKPYTCQYAPFGGDQLVQKQIIGMIGGKCHTTEHGADPKVNSNVMNCIYSASLREAVANYGDALAASRKSGNQLTTNLNGKVEATYSVDGKTVSNPLQEALNNKSCVMSDAVPGPSPYFHAADTGPQKGETTTAGAVINKTLVAVSRYVFRDFQGCNADGESRSFASYSSQCDHGSCTTTVQFRDNSVPKEITLSRQYQSACVAQTIGNLEKYKVVYYSEDIKIDKSMLGQLKISSARLPKITKTPRSKFSTSGAVMELGSGDLVIRLDYGTNAPSSDELLLEGKLITLNYSK